ncbi:GTPase [endosymbiont GvMRE of Glomus versiforme]|uniref:GTPase n=1 Tax=endosymbiont GvMRE of Glomus versiforme TaxID=2039283 RepID=UPI000EC39C7C|nr:GTPase [endosymbiont GvMRE of Glomus versiforme]RHZ36506.1 Cdc15p [endosymbiont GvMRE of Glomus versiforme]
MVNINAQNWLNEKYPVDKACQRDGDSENKNKTRKEITHLDIRKGKVGSFLSGGDKSLVGSLKLEGFTSLRKLIVSSHQLIELDLSECKNLVELDCRSNELNNLNVNGCADLKRVDCSNNNIRELDLSTCSKLEEVNINNCPELTTETIKSNLTYNFEKGKLVKDNTKVKIGPQITKAKENDTRNILVIGITGNGKSALANVLTDTEQFAENASSTSVTKNFQSSNVFEYQGKNYRIIDNIGFGDTNNISDKDVLFKIGEGINSAKEGVNQVLFVFKGRFAPEQVAAFKMFKDFISEVGITKFTTLVRTNFENFQSQESCREDHNDLLSQSQELKEIISSCNSVLHVDNPAIPVIKDKDKGKVRERKEQRIIENKKSREASKEIVLSHLAENCLEIYKLKKWDSIHDKVAGYVNQITQKEQELAQANSVSEKTRLQNEINETKDKVVEEVNVTLEAEISALPKLTARIEMKNISIWPFNK